MLQLLLSIVIISGILISGTRRIKLLTSSFTVQSLAIALACIFLGYTTKEFHYYIMGILTLAIKVLLIPYIIRKSFRTLKIKRELDLIVGGFSSFIFSGLYIMIIFAIFRNFPSIYLKTGIFLILIGITVMVGRKKAITQMVGLLTIENGIILLEISLVKIPMVLEAWMALEVLVLALIMGMMIFHINKTFDTVSTDYLSDLKE